MNKFEQLIEYVINDEDAKARELFHEIVVEKSRLIYEEMMEADNEEGKEEIEEADNEEVEEGKEELEEADNEEVEEGLGGDQADDLMADVEMEEEGMIEGDDEPAADDLEDRVVDLEDKLDELMAEFEALMGDEGGAVGDDMGDDDMEADVELDAEVPDDMDGEELADDELETEGMFEAVTLKSAPAPVKSEEGGINKKPVVAANSGARGAVAKPVHTGADQGGKHDSPAYKNTHKDLIGKVGNTPAQSTQKPSPATKPNLGQAAGVNNKSVIQ